MYICIYKGNLKVKFFSFKLETDLFPCLVAMRHKGVRVDEELAHKYKKELVEKENKLLEKVKKGGIFQKVTFFFFLENTQEYIKTSFSLFLK